MLKTFGRFFYSLGDNLDQPVGILKLSGTGIWNKLCKNSDVKRFPSQLIKLKGSKGILRNLQNQTWKTCFSLQMTHALNGSFMTKRHILDTHKICLVWMPCRLIRSLGQRHIFKEQEGNISTASFFQLRICSQNYGCHDSQLLECLYVVDLQKCREIVFCTFPPLVLNQMYRIE